MRALATVRRAIVRPEEVSVVIVMGVLYQVWAILGWELVDRSYQLIHPQWLRDILVLFDTIGEKEKSSLELGLEIMRKISIQ